MCSITPGPWPTVARSCRAVGSSTRRRCSSSPARQKLKGVLAIDYVVPDYHGVRPKSCMNGWGRQFLNVSPSGKVLPVTRPRRCRAWSFHRCGKHPWPTSGTAPRPSIDFAAPTGWRSPAGAASVARSIGAVAVARPFCSPAMRRAPIRLCALSPDHGVVEAALQDAEKAPDAFVYRAYSKDPDPNSTTSVTVIPTRGPLRRRDAPPRSATGSEGRRRL